MLVETDNAAAIAQLWSEYKESGSRDARDKLEGPVAAFEVEEMKQILADAINRMPEREKIVLTLYYYEGLTLGEIGEVLGVTESRVCQIHTKAVLQLRSKMAEPEREAAG